MYFVDYLSFYVQASLLGIDTETNANLLVVRVQWTGERGADDLHFVFK
jgi:hypothetical protein